MIRSIDDKKVAAQKAPVNALYRSRIEICRILHALAREGCAIFAEPGEDKLFVTRILLVDEPSGYLVIEYGTEKSINSALFDQPSQKFRANYLGAHIVFKVSDPLDALLDDKPAIRFALPRSLICSRRREHPRVVIPPHVALRCIVQNSDGNLFEANIIDISLDGIGGMIYDDAVLLQVGTVLKGCRIIFPGGKSIAVDLVVRHIKTIARPDGTLYKRTGVRFIQRPEEIQALINLFIHDLDRSAS